MEIKKSEWFRQIFVRPNQTIREGVKIMNDQGRQFLIVVDSNDCLLGLVTDGDIRRAIFSGKKFDVYLEEIMTASPIVANIPVDQSKILNLMKIDGIGCVPVVNSNKQVIDLITWKDFLVSDAPKVIPRTEQVVIMAGGKGTRLDPFTKILPKPLIPFGDKPMIEWIMDNFAKYGFKSFWITLNYKRQTIKNYFSGVTKSYDVDFVEEEDFLGTAGALSLLKDKLKETFVVSNCDVVLEDNFSDIVDFHKKKDNLLTIVAVPRHVRIPYGVLEIDQESLCGIKEKPEFTYLVSGGVYIIEPDVLSYIELGEIIQMPTLIERILKDAHKKVGVYPTSGKWFDIGQWEEYQEALLKLTMGGVSVNDFDDMG